MISTLSFTGYYIFNKNKVDDALKKFIFVNFPTFENDDMLLSEGEIMVGVNQDNVNRYIVDNQTEFSSKKELEFYYQKASKNYVDYFERDFGTKMYVYINVVNELSQSMFLNGQFDFENGKINSVSFKWYTGEEIFTVNNSVYSSAVPYKGFKGTNLTVTSKSKIFVDCSASAGTSEYYDIFNEIEVKDDIEENDYAQYLQGLKELRKLCDSIYVDLFKIEVSVKDESNAGKIKIDTNYLDGIYNGSVDYGSSWSDEPYLDIYNHAFEYGIYENYCENTLAMKYTLKNEASISYKYFYLIVDVNRKFVGFYEQSSFNTYDCIFYKSANVSFKSKNLLYDFIYFRPWNYQTLLLRDNAISTGVDSIKQLNPNAMFFDINENDFPVDLFDGIFKRI